MKVETPMLEFCARRGLYISMRHRWVCPAWVKHYFAVKPPRISLEFSDKLTKKAVPIDLWLYRLVINGTADFTLCCRRWAPATRSRVKPPGYQDGAIFPSLAGFLADNGLFTESRQRYYVTVWIHEGPQEKDTSP
jgi:hypothetical protein